MTNKPNYLIYDHVRRDPSLKSLFEMCVDSVLNGTARVEETRRVNKYPSYRCFRVDGREILISALLEYYLYESGKNQFNFEKVKNFSELMRKLCGWQWDVDRVLRSWVECCIRNPFFYNKDEDKNNYYTDWCLKEGEPSWQLPEDFLKFACYIAVSHIRYGADYDHQTADEIFDFVTALGSDLPLKLKLYGSGDLPKEITEYNDIKLSCNANDVTATITIDLKEEAEEYYIKIINFICSLLESGFPKSYRIQFKSLNKNWLPIEGLPKTPVHQLFANAIRWQGVNSSIEKYARIAMKENMWYIDMEYEDCAMPSTFAVFALGLADEKYHQLICDYLNICDGEHQKIHGLFTLAYIEKYGFTKKGTEIYELCENNIQNLPEKLEELRSKRN